MVRTRLEINGQSYAMVTDLPINVTYQQADIREPDKRNATFSKTITLYGTSELNKLFNNIFETNVKTTTFNPNKKVSVKYYVDELLILQGDLQLLKVNLMPDNNIVYECNILGKEGSIFVDIADLYLTDLDFSEYDHLYDWQKQTQSWYNICTLSGTDTNVGLGKGYYYGFIDRGFSSSETDFDTTYFLPQLFAREYLEKIFINAGYTWSSNFLDSTEFKRLVIEPNMSSVELSTNEIDLRQMNVGLNSDYNLTQHVSNYYAIPYNNTSYPFFDLSGQFGGGLMNVAYDGWYNFTSIDKIDVSFTHSNSSVATASFEIDTTKQFKLYDGSWTLINSHNNIFTFTNISKGVNYECINSCIVEELFIHSGNLIEPSTNIFTTVPNFYDVYGNPILGGTWNVILKLKSGANGSSFYANLTRKGVIAPNLLHINNAIPKKIKQRDFLKSIMQMFNLMIEPDKNNPKLLYIEPYKEFFNGIGNWENRIDLDKEISVNPLMLMDGKKYIYQYKSDSDFYNSKYQNNWNETFGARIVDVDNDFLTAEKKTEVIFSGTPNVQNLTLGIAVPKIYKNQTAIAPQSPNIRILYANGPKPTLISWNYIQYVNYKMDTYGSVSHVDNELNPTIDLNFGVLNETYYSYTLPTFTTNNLYNRFHKEMLVNLVNRDSKVLIAYLWLTPSDIANFSFRKKYFIKDAYYIINKIIDYNPMNQTSTKCELIKVLNINLF